MCGLPDKKGEDSFSLSPCVAYNIGDGTPENLLDYIQTFREELVRVRMPGEDYDNESHRELVCMQVVAAYTQRCVKS